MYTKYFHGKAKRKKKKDNFIQREKMHMTCALHVGVLIKSTKIFEIEINKNNYYILFIE